MNIVLWVMMGSVLGVLFDIFTPQPLRGGIVGITLLSVVGSILGGFTSHQLMSTALFAFNLESLTFSILGSLCLLGMSKFFSTDISRFHKFER